MKLCTTALCMVWLVTLAACDGGGTDEQPDEPDAYASPATSVQPGAADPSSSAGAAGGLKTAEARIEPTEGNEARGIVRFSATDGTVTIAGTINGLEPGAHGLHVHENGDCSAPDASSAGGHFDPHGDPHGSPRDDEDSHHVGDLGNITADADGEAEVSLDDTEMQLTGPESVIGRALVVHAGQDDFETQPAGDSGARVGCGVIRETH
jgi:superoxide dismutase, Cu-Zn family